MPKPRELPEMYRVLSSLGIDRWQIDQAYAEGRLKTSTLKDATLAWLEVAKDSYGHILRDYLASYPRMPDWRLEIVQVFRYDTLGAGFRPAATIDEHPCQLSFRKHGRGGR